MLKTLVPSAVTSRDPKGLEFMSIVEASYNKARLSEKEAQWVNDSPGLADLIADFISNNRVTNKFKDEEVVSTHGYLSGYKKPKSIKEQCNILRKIFPEIGFANEKLAEREVPVGAEGWFAIPKWQTIAPTYTQAVQKVLDAMKLQRQGKFYNWKEGQINDQQLHESRVKMEVFQRLGNEQKDQDILVVAAQFGLRHRGRSVRRAREIMIDNGMEFGLGAFEIGIMLLTHLERLQDYNDLSIDCSGDEFDDPDSDVHFGLAPFFRFGSGGVRFDVSFSSGGVRFDTFFVGIVDASCGTASGFVPQQCSL